MLTNNMSREQIVATENNGVIFHGRFQVAMRRFDRAYFPFAWFKDCDKGNKNNRDKAFKYNKENKDLIIPFLCAWMLRAGVCALGLMTAENLQSLGQNTSLMQATFAIFMTLCLVFSMVMWVGWLGLTYFRR
jgi:hypothetical protein